MKIVIVCDVFGEKNNGTTIAADNLANYLEQHGETVTILCADKNLEGKEGFEVVPSLYLGKYIKRVLDRNYVTLARPKRGIIENAVKDADIVHIMMPLALGRKTLKIAKKFYIPVSAGFHCQAENVSSHFGLMNRKFVNKLIYLNFYNKFYKRIDVTHYPTEFIKNLFEREIKKETKGYVISNGVNDIYRKVEIHRKPPLDKNFNILMIGRLVKEKSQKLLIEAVSFLKYKDQIQIVFAGKGPDKQRLIQLADKLKITPPIINFYSREDLNTVINSCDLYVHTAEVEIEAISCLEAISCGLVPVISNSKRSATKELALTSNNLFNYDSPQDLAVKIDYWIEHPKEKSDCSKQYLEYTKKFNQTECMEQMHEMLRSFSKRPTVT